MKTRFLLAPTFVFLLSLPLTAQEPKDPQQIIQQMLLAWKEPNASVRTLNCRVSVESFYPKGCLSAEHNRGADNQDRINELIPDKDTRITDGMIHWAIDFDGTRIRKVVRNRTPRFQQNARPDLSPEHTIHIFANKKYRVFRPRADNWTEKEREDKSTHPDVHFYEGQASEFLLTFSELPLIWAAGGVSGKLLLPGRMKLLDGPEQWTYLGEGEVRGNKCHLLSVPNQDSKSSVLEFWVGREPHYPIYVCRAKIKEMDWIPWQLDVEYERSQGRQKLAAWTYTEYESPTRNVPVPKVQWAHTYRVVELLSNPSLADDLFDHRPSKGMVVFHAPDNRHYEVAADGSLVPWSPKDKSSGARRWLYIISGIVLALCLIFAVRAWRRKTNQASA